MAADAPFCYWRSDPRLSELGRDARDAGYEVVARKRYVVVDRLSDVPPTEGALVARPLYTRLDADEPVDIADCDVVVVALSIGGPGLVHHVLPAVPCVAVIERGGTEAAQPSIESRADAFLTSAHRLAEAIAWVTSEDRAARTVGQPRLIVIGTSHGDFGNSRTLTAEPTIIGRSMVANIHPQRPDRMPTPTGTIARHHAQVRCIDGVVSVRDLRSTNGTLVIRHGEPARLLCPQEQPGTGLRSTRIVVDHARSERRVGRDPDR